MAEGFFFEVGEEGFHGSVVPTITSPRHGRGHGSVLGEDCITVGGVLVALVGVQEQSRWNAFLLLGSLQGLQDETQGILSPEMV